MDYETVFSSKYWDVRITQNGSVHFIDIKQDNIGICLYRSIEEDMDLTDSAKWILQRSISVRKLSKIINQYKTLALTLSEAENAGNCTLNWRLNTKSSGRPYLKSQYVGYLNGLYLCIPQIYSPINFYRLSRRASKSEINNYKFFEKCEQLKDQQDNIKQEISKAVYEEKKCLVLEHVSKHPEFTVEQTLGLLSQVENNAITLKDVPKLLNKLPIS